VQQFLVGHNHLIIEDSQSHRTTLDRTLLDKGSVQPRDLYLTTHDTDKKETSMTSVGFEPTISASVDRRLKPRTHWDGQTNQIHYTTQIK